MSTITVISKQKIEVIKELAFLDKTPELAKVGVAIGSDLMRVQTLKPVSYKFIAGTNIVPEPFTFTDPVSREEVTESILTWPGVKRLIETGVFEVYRTENKVTADEEIAQTAKTKKAPNTDKSANAAKPKKSLAEMSEEV